MKPEKFNQIVEDNWESIAYVAYDGFQKMGRGLVVLLEDKDSLDHSYVVLEEGTSDPRTSRLVSEYEIIS